MPVIGCQLWLSQLLLPFFTTTNMKIKHICEACGKEFERERCYIQRSIRNGRRVTCKPGCINRLTKKSIVGELNPAWKGGVAYKLHTCPVCKLEFTARKIRIHCYQACYSSAQKTVPVRYQHNGRRHYAYTKIAENILGRPLKVNEVVHHVDGDYKNNHPTNLRVMTNVEHSKLHSKERHQLRKKVL